MDSIAGVGVGVRTAFSDARFRTQQKLHILNFGVKNGMLNVQY